jgi:hypothetical protein
MLPFGGAVTDFALAADAQRILGVVCGMGRYATLRAAIDILR